jgi:PIN domain nuclease of toxin-antitoxin system
VRLLLDTHTFVWWVNDDDRLSARARRVIADGKNEIFFSVVSAWELVIKARTGDGSLRPGPETYIPEQLEQNTFQVLPVQLGHALKVATLPDLHRDPFDRLLVAQALTDGLALISRDRGLGGYSVKVVW